MQVVNILIKAQFTDRKWQSYGGTVCLPVLLIVDCKCTEDLSLDL